MYTKHPKVRGAVRHALFLSVLLMGLLASTMVLARGGQAADDCQPGSKDPDCVKSNQKP